MLTCTPASPVLPLEPLVLHVPVVEDSRLTDVPYPSGQAWYWRPRAVAHGYYSRVHAQLCDAYLRPNPATIWVTSGRPVLPHDPALQASSPRMSGTAPHATLLKFSSHARTTARISRCLDRAA